MQNNAIALNILHLSQKWDININIDEKEKFIEFVIRITKRCNENCLFCNTTLDKSNITFDNFIEIVNYIQEKYYEYTLVFCLSGGEPTLHKDFTKIIAHLYEKWLRIKIQTNGALFSSKNFLMKIQPFSENIEFFISFHSHIPSIYNAITQSDLYASSLKWIINIFKTFDSSKIQINFVLCKINYWKYEDYLHFLKKNFWQYAKKVNLIFSVIYPNKEHHKKLLINYTDAANLINETLHLWDEKLGLNYEFWSYCQLPLCFLNKLNLDATTLWNVWLDKNVWIENMKFTSQCIKCKHYDSSCIWLPKMYLEVFWENHVIPIIDTINDRKI